MAEKETYDPNEIALVKFIKDKCYEPAKKWKYYYAGDKQKGWLDNIKWYKGIQWSSKRSKDKSSVFFNRLFSTIQQELPFMTDRIPKIFVTPSEPSDKPFANIFEKLIENSWVERDMETKLPEATMHAKQLGTAFYRPFWNTELVDRLGDIDCEVVDSLECFPFAYSRQLKDAEGFIRVSIKSLGWIRRNYPKDGWRVKAETKSEWEIPDRAKDTSKVEGSSYSQVSDMGAGSTYTADSTNYLPSPAGGSIEGSDFKRVLFIECYIKDGSTKDVEDDEKKEKKKEAIYPNGRMITIAGNVVLEDVPFAFEFFPFIEQKNYINPGEFWGMDDITQIKEGQKELNKFQAMVIDAMRRDVYKQHFIQAGSGIDVDNYVRSSDSVYETKIPNPVTETGQWSLPSQVFAWGDILEKAIEKTAGIGEYTAPATGNLPSGRALAQFQEMTRTRLRQKIRNMEYSVRMIGKAWLEMILKNYTEQRIMRIMNSNTRQQEYVFIFKEDNPERAMAMKQQVAAEVVEGSEQKDEQGQVIPGSGEPKYKYILNMAEIKGGFDLTVATNSTVSVSSVANWEQAFAMFQAGLIDQQAALDAADYPEREEILKRMSQNAQAAQQQQQQMLQQQMQLEQAKVQQEGQGKMLDNQTKLKTNVLDNQTELQKAQMANQSKQMTAREARLAKLEGVLR